MPVAAYVVHWNAPEWCVETVRSLAASDVPVDVTVLNNGGDLDVNVPVVQTGANLGFAGAANQGLDLGVASHAPFILIGCHDMQINSTGVRSMVEHMTGDPGLGIVGPVLDGHGGTESDLPWISGTCLLIRRQVAERVRFDERWGSYVEDVDYCYRARDLGWRVGRTGSAHVATQGSVDLRAADHLTHANTLVFFVRRRLWRDAVKRLLLMARTRRFGSLFHAARQGVRFAITDSSHGG